MHRVLVAYSAGLSVSHGWLKPKHNSYFTFMSCAAVSAEEKNTPLYMHFRVHLVLIVVDGLAMEWMFTVPRHS